MIKKILVYLDGSAQAEQGLPYAIRLANQLEAGLVVAVAVAGSPDREKPGIDKSNAKVGTQVLTPHLYRETINQTITGIAMDLALDPEKLKIQYTYMGDLSSVEEITFEIRELVYHEQIDLVVLVATQRPAPGFDRLLLGNLVSEVVHYVEAPILLLPPNSEGYVQSLGQAAAKSSSNLATGKSQNKILLTLDGSPKAEAALNAGMDLADQLKASLHLCQVVPTPGPFGSGALAWLSSPFAALDERQKMLKQAQEYLEKIQGHVREKGLKCEWEVRSGQPAEEIISYASELKPTLVVMATHARTRIGQLFLGSVAQQVVRNNAPPLILVHIPHPHQEIG